MAAPSGPIQTTTPKGRRFECGWENITRWLPQLEAASARYPKATVPLMASMMVIESCGNHVDANGQVIKAKPDGYGGGRATGLMQIKDGLWANFVPGENINTPRGNITTAAALIHNWVIEQGSWQEMIKNRYHPGTDPGSGFTPDTYVQTVRKLMREWEQSGVTPGPEPLPPTSPAPADPWRPYPYPKMVDLIVQKPYDGAGFDRVEFRRPLIRGFSTHITDGPQSQTIEFFASFFGTGGARQYDALTDLVIGADGRIGLLNDWRDPDRGGTRAGWANGGVDGLEGPGVAFYRRFPRINVHLVSCEHCAKAGQQWTDAEIASSIEIRTAIAQELQCPWQSYPEHPSYGVSIEQAHTFFASKSCPAEPYLTTYEPIILAEVKQKLRQWQTGTGSGDPVPEPPPVDVPTFTDYGLTLETVEVMFGEMKRYEKDGTVTPLPFNESGPLSMLWLERSEREGNFPEAESMQLLDSTRTPGADWFAMWSGGWTALVPADDTRASWMWLDELNNAPKGTPAVEESEDSG